MINKENLSLNIKYNIHCKINFIFRINQSINGVNHKDEHRQDRVWEQD